MDGFFSACFFFSFAIWYGISECVCAHFYDYLRNILFDYIGFSLTYSAPFLSLHTLNAMDLAHLLQCAPIQSHFTFFLLYGFFSVQREKIVVFQCCCCCFMALYVNRCCWFFFFVSIEIPLISPVDRLYFLWLTIYGDIALCLLNYYSPGLFCAFFPIWNIVEGIFS